VGRICGRGLDWQKEHGMTSDGMMEHEHGDVEDDELVCLRRRQSLDAPVLLRITVPRIYCF